jgi:hypothetical protein
LEVAFPICQLMEAKGPRSISLFGWQFFGKTIGLGAQNMNNIVGRSAGWGAIFGAAAAFASGLCLAIFWSTARTGHAGDFTTLMILWVPPVAIMGAGAAAVLFGVVAVIVSFSPGRIEASPISYAVLGSLLSLGIIILPFASWVAGGLHRALQGAQGTYLLLPTALLPVAIAGFLTGWMVRSGRNRSTPVS